MCVASVLLTHAADVGWVSAVGQALFRSWAHKADKAGVTISARVVTLEHFSALVPLRFRAGRVSVVGSLAAPLASTHWMLVAASP